MSVSFHSQTRPTSARADFPKPVVLERSSPALDTTEERDHLCAIAESARRLPPPFQRVLEVTRDDAGVSAVLERFSGVTGLQLDRGLRDEHRLLPLPVWLGLADAWLTAIAAVSADDPIAWTTTWHPSQIGVDVTGALMFTFHEHNHVLGHWPIAPVLRTDGMMGPSLPATINPESAKGRPIGPASHVHSLGSSLILLLTGERPFHGEHEFSRLQAVTEGTPVWHPEHHPECPPALGEVLHQAIRLDPATRWPDVASFREALLAAAPVKPARPDAIAGAFFGVRPDRVGEAFLPLQREPELLPAAWNAGGLQVMEDRIRELLLPLDAFPINQRGPDLPRPGRPGLGAAQPAKPGWWQRVFGNPTSRRGS